MTSDHYFKQWKKLLRALQDTVESDIRFQNDKVNDKKLCDAVQRLSGILGKYIFLYNQLVENAKMNLQVQKAKYMEELTLTVVARVLELQRQIRKLDGSHIQFLSKSLIDHKLTTDDVELTDIPKKINRPDHVQEALHNSIMKAEEKKRLEEEENRTIHSEAPEIPWWEKDSTIEDIEHEEEELGEKELELKKRKDLLNLIAAHEKTRQTLMERRKYKSKRETWTKKLEGSLQPPAAIEIRKRAAQFIQRFARAYFEIKRKKIEKHKRDHLLGYEMMCEIPRADAKLEVEKMTRLREQKRRECERKWKHEYEEMKLKLNTKGKDKIAEDYRDEIRDWFQTWYKEAMFFYDIPLEKKGGSALILKEELPTPSQWHKEYKTYQAKKNNPKSSQQHKQEKLAAQHAAQSEKKAQKVKLRMEAALLRKSMRNPGQHPGYTYPISKKTDAILKVLQSYHKDWDSLDTEDTLNVKEGHITTIDESSAWMEIKMEVRTEVDADMRNELKKLRLALKEDYKRLDEEMPVMIPNPNRKRKKKKIIEDPINNDITEKLQKLISRGCILEYPRIKFEDIMGDPNFAGEDLRAQLIPPTVIGAETRRSWWKRCRKFTEGFQRILLVGPKGSGKSTLAYALATINDAVFFDLDPVKITTEDETTSEEDLQELIGSVVACARAVQPAVIFIRHIQRLYYRKTLPKEASLDHGQLRRCMIKPILKKIRNTDYITIIGTCTDPWLTKGKLMLRHFPNVLLTPNTSYSLTYQILNSWVVKNRVVPPDLDVHSLAHMLKGYSFDFLTKKLEAFLTADQIIKIAAQGLSPHEVYNFVIQNDKEGKPDYGKYLDWYSKTTPLGRTEQKHLAEQRAFRDLERQWQEKMAKKKTKARSGAASTAASSLAGSM